MRAIRERPRLAPAKLAAALAAPVATALLAAAVANNDSDGSADLQRRLDRSEQLRHEQSGELQHLAAQLNGSAPASPRPPAERGPGRAQANACAETCWPPAAGSPAAAMSFRPLRAE
jgi:hypothetical protein